jgi:hypothetical protein
LIFCVAFCSCHPSRCYLPFLAQVGKWRYFGSGRTCDLISCGSAPGFQKDLCLNPGSYPGRKRQFEYASDKASRPRPSRLTDSSLCQDNDLDVLITLVVDENLVPCRVLVAFHRAVGRREGERQREMKDNFLALVPNRNHDGNRAGCATTLTAVRLSLSRDVFTFLQRWYQLERTSFHVVGRPMQVVSVTLLNEVRGH